MFQIQVSFIGKLKQLIRTSGWFIFGTCLLIGFVFAFLLGHSVYKAFAQPSPNLGGYDPYINPGVNITHVPPIIARTGDSVRLEFLLDCGYTIDADLPCDSTAILYVAFGPEDKFSPIGLTKEDHDSLEVLVAELPAADDNGQALQYYIEIDNPATKIHSRYPLYGAIELMVVPSFTKIDLPYAGPIVSGDLVVNATWGGGLREVGLSNKEHPSPMGPDAFDIAPNGDIALLDEVNKRVLLFNLSTGETSSYPINLKGWGDLAFNSTGQLLILDLVGDSSSDNQASPQLYLLDFITKSARHIGPVFVNGAIDLKADNIIVDNNLGRVTRPIDLLGNIRSPEEQFKGYYKAQLLTRWQDDFRSLFADIQQGLVFDIQSVEPLGAIGHFSKIGDSYIVVFEGKYLRILWLDNSGQIVNDVSVPNQAQNPFYPHGRFFVSDDGSVYYLNTIPSGMEIRRVENK